MVRLLIAVAVGIVIAVGATVALTSALANVSNGTPSPGSIYQYGTR